MAERADLYRVRLTLELEQGELNERGYFVTKDNASAQPLSLRADVLLPPGPKSDAYATLSAFHALAEERQKAAR